MSSETMEFGPDTVTLSNLDKVMFPDAGLTKRDLIEYYLRIADTMLPHMRDRPLNMQRFPDGIDGAGFYEKELPDYFPDWVTHTTVSVKDTGETQRQVVCDKTATLVYLANQACITPHLWLSRRGRLDHPDKLIFDLDPPDRDDNFAPVRHAARRLRDALRERGLVPFVMTTGSKGLHVVAPLQAEADFDTVRDFARNLAETLAQRHPDDFTTEPRKDQRKGRLFLDYLRNAYGQTAVAPYALRPLSGAPVATPLDWSELDDADMGPQRYRVDNIFRRLGQKDDPWRDMDAHRSSFGQIATEKSSLGKPAGAP